MRDFNESYKLQIKYNIDSVLEAAECQKSNPKYEDYKKMFIELVDKYLPLINPIGYVINEASNRYVPVTSFSSIYCLITVGHEIDKLINDLFANFMYLEGMMMSSLVDQIMFNGSDELYHILTKEFKNEGYLTSRYEPGNGDIPLEIQKELVENVNQLFKTDYSTSEGFMITPSKSMTYFYGLTDTDCSYGVDHDCSACNLEVCKHRKYSISIYNGDEKSVIQAKKGENLLEVLRRNEYLVQAPCGGKKLCGKCRVKAQGHNYELAKAEQDFLSVSDMKDDVVLACFHNVDQDLHIVLGEESHQEIEVDYINFNIKEAKSDIKGYGVGVDIGTTTIVVSLVDLQNGEILGVQKQLNPQKSYGADIISRIMYVADPESDNLGLLVKQSIMNMTKSLLKSINKPVNELKDMVISGNTTMIYLLLDMDPAPLAVAPFVTEDINLQCDICSSFFVDEDMDFNITIMPFVSAYVGGDIVSGLYATHMIDKSKTTVFVDIGTNGEMVVLSNGRMLSAATAAGPAFEGANIKCGMGSVGGAICEIKVDEQNETYGYSIKTLGDLEAIGICGSALVDAIALLHKQGYIEDSGFMKEAVFIYDNIAIYPEDVRQVQLAKAAILAGVDVLLDELGVSYSDVDNFYLAGGFGSHLNIENSAYIGLIPESIQDKVTVVGNTSLAGSVRYLLEKNASDEVLKLKEKCEDIELSTNMKFNEAYIMGMGFGGKR